MKKETAKLRWHELIAVLRNELKYIFTDSGVILILLGAVIIYSTAYGYAYDKEVLRDIPVAVVDYSKTPESREFARFLDAGQNMNVVVKPTDLDEARDMFMRRDIHGIIVIPDDFAKDLYTMDKAFISVYADASYFLVYKQVFYNVALGMMDKNSQIKINRYLSNGMAYEQAKVISDPVKINSTTLFNPSLGYGSFVMPAILVLILQQTLLISIGMVGGTWRERGLYSKLIPRGRENMTSLPIVFGRAASYAFVSVFTMTFLYVFQYKVFNYPMNGKIVDLLSFMLPYLLSVIFLGITLSTLFKRRENSIIVLLFTSIPLVMISGISVPHEAMPHWLVELGKIVPSSSGINGFMRIQSMGATLQEVLPEYRLLWILTGVYFLTAAIGTRGLARRLSKDEGEELPDGK